MKQSIQAHDIPEIPNNKVGIDVAEINDKTFQNVEKMFLLNNKSTREKTKVFKFLFRTHGIPEVIIVDNNPFHSHEFKEFSNDWKFSIDYKVL